MNASTMDSSPFSKSLRLTGLPPGPRSTSVLTNAYGMTRNPLRFLTNMAREHGDIVRIRLPGQQIFLLNHPDTIEEVLLSKSDSFIKDAFTRELGLVIGKGLLTSEGALWKRQRRLAQPAFHHRRVTGYAKAMVRHAERAVAELAPGEPRDIHQDMMRLTLDIAAETLFGADVGSAANQISEAIEALMDRFTGTGSMIPSFLPTPGNLRARRALRRIDEVVFGIIAERRRQTRARDDLLSMLLEATDGEGSMDDRQLRDEVVTLLLAGHETTALAVSYTLYLLSRHPEVDAALSEEIRSVVGDRAPTYEDLPELGLVDKVVRESMRLYPPAWAIGREATMPCRVGGFDAAPGTQIWAVQWVVHRDPRFYEEPEAFRPDRWTDEFVKSLPRFAYFPFGGGRRVCIGNSFAMMETALVVATLVQHFRFLPASDDPLEILPSVTLRPKHGVFLQLERR